MLTGDWLFVGDAGRPDLAVEAQEGAEGQFHSLRRLVELGDGVEVFPGHVAGSLCGAAMSSKASTTIGFERRSNHALQGELADFLAARARPAAAAAAEHGADRRAEPRRVRRRAAAARADRRCTGRGDRPRRPPDRGVRGRATGRAPSASRSRRLELRDEGGVRPAGAAARPPRDRRGRGQLRRARRSQAVAIFDLAGWEEGGGAERLRPVSLEELEQLLADDAVELLDVREANERDEGHIPGSRHLPYRTARAAAEAGLLDGRPVVTICESGPRAAIAASVLQAAGNRRAPGARRRHRDVARRDACFRRCGG